MRNSRIPRVQKPLLESSADGRKLAQEQPLEGPEGCIIGVSRALLAPIQSISGYLELIFDGKVPTLTSAISS